MDPGTAGTVGQQKVSQVKCPTPRTVLAVDPGKRSGFAVVVNGKVEEAGELRIDSRSGLDLAQQLLHRMPTGTLVCIEDVGYIPAGRVRVETLHHLGVRAGVWACLARQRGFTVQWVHPSQWQGAMLGRGYRRDMLKRLACARARHEAGRMLGENASDAVCLGLFVAGELARPVGSMV